ncbi:hypothetical protein [Agromyces bauzanensis]
MSALAAGRVPLAQKMVARYEDELAHAPATTEAQIAHRGIVETLLADWRRRLELITEYRGGERR